MHHFLDVLNIMTDLLRAKYPGAQSVPKIPARYRDVPLVADLINLKQVSSENSILVARDLSMDAGMRDDMVHMWKGINYLCSACQMAKVQNCPEPKFRTMAEFEQWAHDFSIAAHLRSGAKDPDAADKPKIIIN